MKFFFSSLLILFLVVVPVAVSAQAVTAEVPFGGPLLFTFFCGCSGNFMNYIFDDKTLTTLPLVFQPGLSILYSSYNILTPGTQELGVFIPGAGQCWVPAPDGCNYIPSFGAYGNLPGTGTTLTPSL